MPKEGSANERPDALSHADHILNFQEIFGRGVVGEILQRDESGEYQLTNADAFHKIFHPDPHGAADLTAAIRAGGDTVITTVEQGAIWLLRKTGIIADGYVNAPSLSLWIDKHKGPLSCLPHLHAQLQTAFDAQSKLDRVLVQKRLSEEINGGALRNRRGVITRKSFLAWLQKNEADLERSQEPGVLRRLRQIGSNLPEYPGGLAGILSPKFRTAYSKAIERSIFDPEYARQLQARVRD